MLEGCVCVCVSCTVVSHGVFQGLRKREVSKAKKNYIWCLESVILGLVTKVAWCQSKAGLFVCTGPCRTLWCSLFKLYFRCSLPDGYSPVATWTNPPFTSSSPYLFFFFFFEGAGGPILPLREVFHMSVTHGYKYCFPWWQYPLAMVTMSSFYYRCLCNNFHIVLK